MEPLFKAICKHRHWVFVQVAPWRRTLRFWWDCPLRVGWKKLRRLRFRRLKSHGLLTHGTKPIPCTKEKEQKRIGLWTTSKLWCAASKAKCVGLTQRWLRPFALVLFHPPPLASTDASFSEAIALLRKEGGEAVAPRMKVTEAEEFEMQSVVALSNFSYCY